MRTLSHVSIKFNIKSSNLTTKFASVQKECTDVYYVCTVINKKKKMSKTTIPHKVQCEVWGRAAGRCEFNGCNKPLYVHDITSDKCNIAELAHIIGDSLNGPRGDKEHSELLAKDPNNIMLMCHDCHKYIDKEGLENFPDEVLFAMKKKHEERVERLTSMKEDMQANVVTYGSIIGSQFPDLSYPQIQEALQPNYYPAQERCIDLGGNWPTATEWDEYWKREVENLEYTCKNKILYYLDRWEHKRIALFAFAPMPLLIKLGTLLNNKHEVEVYQKQRSGGWKWLQEEIHTNYIINRPEDTQSDPTLVLSLSFPIGERIKKNHPEASIWEMTIEKPNTDYLRSKQQLYDFGRQVELLMDEIDKASKGKPLHLFMSVPVACAIEFGRVWMQKANSPLYIYDYDKRDGEIDRLAITIENK